MRLMRSLIVQWHDGPKQDEVKAALDKHGFEYTSDGNSITVIGKSVHAMMAPEGTNAVLRLAIALMMFLIFKPLDFIGKLFKECQAFVTLRSAGAAGLAGSAAVTAARLT